MINENYIQEKKAYIIQVLESLTGIWDLAIPMIKLVNSIEVTENTIYEIANIIEVSYENATSEFNKEKMLNAISNIKAINFKEAEEKNEEIKNLEKILTNF